MARKNDGASTTRTRRLPRRPAEIRQGLQLAHLDNSTVEGLYKKHGPLALIGSRTKYGSIGLIGSTTGSIPRR